MLNYVTKVLVLIYYIACIGSQGFSSSDVFISVVTSKAYSMNRLPMILKTWFLLAKEQTWFFTDEANLARLQRVTGGHMVHAKCSPKNMCCKTSVSLNFFLRFSTAKWYCQFRDTSYVNIRRLFEVLASFNSRTKVYLGRIAVDKPFILPSGKPFWYANFEAGYCLSRTVALRMQHLVKSGSFLKGCNTRGGPDITIAFMLTWVYNTSLINVPYLNGPSERISEVDSTYFSEQISLSYAKYAFNVENFFARPDPTRMYSLHCTLYPKTESCSYLQKRLKTKKFEDLSLNVY